MDELSGTRSGQAEFFGEEGGGGAAFHAECASRLRGRRRPVSSVAMPTYVYETIPQKAGDEPERFEVHQSMHDAALTQHPETGAPVRRVIAGGIGIITQHAAPPRPQGCCGGQGGCGCACQA